MDTKNHKRAKQIVLILHRVNFYFQIIRQPKKPDFQKYFQKTDISLISF